jgi:hypothetical protein
VITNHVAAYNQGDGMWVYSQDCAKIINCTLAFNYGYGLCIKGFVQYLDQDYYLRNTIVWMNQGHEFPPGTWDYKQITIEDSPANMWIDNCDIMGGQSSIVTSGGGTYTWGSGNIDADPKFYRPLLFDFHITTRSPCKDAGSNSYIYPPYYDFDGQIRANGTVDIGADEFWN